MTMGLFKRSDDGAAWRPSTSRAPRDSEARGTHRAHVNADQAGEYPTRRAAMRAARAEAGRRNRADEAEWRRAAGADD
jgi:hypothetical protein